MSHAWEASRGTEIPAVTAPKTLMLLCAGLDSVQRGYEAQTRHLFNSLKEDMAGGWRVLLVKRDGPRRKDEIVLPTPSRGSRLVRSLARFRGDNLYWEQVFFSLAFILWCFFAGKRVERICTSEPVVSKFLFRLKFLFFKTPEIVFRHGVNMNPPEYVDCADRIHEVNIENFERAREFSPHKTIRLIPCFDVSLEAVSDPMAVERFRSLHGLGGRRVILNVGVVSRVPKRTDHLLREAIDLPADTTVMVCGLVSDPTVVEEGRALLGDRFQQFSLTFKEVHDAYGIASLLVHCTISEGFGAVVIEAMNHGLPVLVHRCRLFEWIVKDPEQCIDMEKKGELGNVLGSILKQPAWLRAKGERNRETFLRYYSWPAVKEELHALLFS